MAKSWAELETSARTVLRHLYDSPGLDFKGYEHTLAYVAEELEGEGKELYTNWRYDIVEPIHTAANSGESAE